MYSFPNFKNHKSQKGSFLAASPFITNKTLQNAVIVILECNESIVSAVKINQTKLKQEEYCSYPMYDGGLSDHKKILLLHSGDKKLANTNQLTEDIFVTDMDETTQFYPKKYYAVPGCMSWMYEDFMKEVKNSEWIPVMGSSKLVFDTPIIKRWHEAYRSCGIRPELIQREYAIN
ncbi:YqgE/AlgH family protein [Candidatus Cytomitobacter primus]|uniref:YqgE/AlgH family protein n=1 Tax=Candidatus Cytomitobacter primus TaxID=2066024 RepID=UPI001653C896|nr:YqgE/AlgH family protein [Candidatus Cytomitobacter primus]